MEGCGSLNSPPTISFIDSDTYTSASAIWQLVRSSALTRNASGLSSSSASCSSEVLRSSAESCTSNTTLACGKISLTAVTNQDGSLCACHISASRCSLIASYNWSTSCQTL